MEEIWKDIQGFEGRYQVSNLGNVKSLKYRGQSEAKNLVPKCNNSGRLWVELFRDGRKKCLLIHRIVAQAFIPNPNSLPQINHIDENPKNNRVDNLEWCTGSYNIRAYLNNHPDCYKGRKRRSSFYKHRTGQPVIQCTKDGEIINHWDDVRTIERINKWSAWSIAECCRGNRKTAYGYTWRYANENISDKEAAI